MRIFWGDRSVCNLATRFRATPRQRWFTGSAIGVGCKRFRLPAACVSPYRPPDTPYEWTYITLRCFLRALTMTDRPRKDTDLSLFVGPYQLRSGSCIPPPSFSSGAPDPFRDLPNKSGCRIWTVLALNLVNEMV